MTQQSPNILHNPNSVADTDPILILGIGNLLMGDEGVGVHFARRMAEREWPAHVSVLDGGTAGFNLMEALEQHPIVFMIDAALEPERTGEYRMITPKFSKDYPRSMSTHDIGLKDLLDGLAILGRLPKVHLFVVSIPDIQPMRDTLSPEVEALLPKIEAEVIAQIEAYSNTE
jgi:hydrogenase maturation protease